MMNGKTQSQQAQAFDGRFQIRTVLLEAHQQLRAAMVSGLRSRGFGEIISTANLQMAIQTLAAGGIDLLLVDLDEGWRESCDLMRRIRAGQCGDNPFIVAVALSSAPDRRQVRRDAANTSIAISVPNTMADKAIRPVNKDTLRARIAAARAEIDHLGECVLAEANEAPLRQAAGF